MMVEGPFTVLQLKQIKEQLKSQEGIIKYELKTTTKTGTGNFPATSRILLDMLCKCTIRDTMITVKGTKDILNIKYLSMNY